MLKKRQLPLGVVLQHYLLIVVRDIIMTPRQQWLREEEVAPLEEDATITTITVVEAGEAEAAIIEPDL